MKIFEVCEVFGSLDWGFNAPGCYLLWVCLPDGHYHIAREIKFKGKSVVVVAEEIRELHRRLGVKTLRYIAADPSIWAKTGHGKGESIAESLTRRGLPMRRGDNDRFNGWLRVHELLALAPDGTPWLTVEDAPYCAYLRRSIAAQVSDPKDPDDIDTTGDDHAVDALRYGAMSRPSPTVHRREKRIIPGTAGALLAEAIRGASQTAVLGSGNVRQRA